MKKFCFVLGTRPEIIKLAPLLRRCVDKKIPFTLIHTNQHYDHAMDGIFFEELNLPSPDHQLKAAAATPKEFMRNVIDGLQKLWVVEKPSVVIVQGDTNTVAAAAIAAERAGIPVAHVEAGLRSGDLKMPEEINRIIADHIAARLYAPTAHQVEKLAREAIPESRIVLAGNTIADAVSEHVTLSDSIALPKELRALPQEYALLTLHRPALVDHADALQHVLSEIASALGRMKMRCVFLAHPRTRKTLESLRFDSPAILIHEPVGYLEMLRLMIGAKAVITDSGGLQEETALLRIPCVTLRTTTERPETLDAGGNILIAPTDETIGEQICVFLQKKIAWKPLYACAHPSDTMIADLLKHYS